MAQLHRYVVALGSNRPHHRHGAPRAILAAALAALDTGGLRLLAASPVVDSRPLGPSLRTYANAVAAIAGALEPEEMLERLQAIEARFGRRRGGRRWAARVLDLDLILWDGGPWASPELIIPHPAYRTRGFVLSPLSGMKDLPVALSRDPLTGLTPAQLLARLVRPRPVGPRPIR